MKIKIASISLFLLTMFVSCEGTDIVPDFVQPEFRGSIKNGFLDTPLAFKIGATHTIGVNFFNDIGMKEAVAYESNDATVLTIDKNGVITAVGAGTTKIRAVVKNSNSSSSETTPSYSVESKDITVTLFDEELTITSPIIILKVGATHQLGYSYKNPKGEVDTTTILTWSSSDVSIISVSDNGLITALKGGKSTITISTKDKKIFKTVEISVELFPEELSITNPITLLEKGKTHQLAYRYKNSNGKIDTTTKLKWTSSDTSVAMVSEKGLVTALKNGKATIMLSTDGDTISSSFDINVKDLISVISFDNILSNSLKIEETHTFTTTFYDKTGVSNTAINRVWTSSDSSIIAVNSSGTISAIGVGMANITVSVMEDGKSISTSTNVTTTNNSLTISNNLLTSIKIGATHQYTTAFSGTTSITWTSSNTSVATVSSSGLITAVGVGNTTITASTTEGGAVITDTNSVTIVNNSLSIDNKITSLGAGKTHQYMTTFGGSTVISWSSSNTSVATVSSSGLVTAIGSGSVTITASTIEGGNNITATDDFSVTSSSKTGTLNGTYQLAGSVTLQDSKLTFSSDFKLSSGLPGGYIYMSNNPNTLSGAIEVGAVTTFSGATTYTVPGNIGLNDYKYVIIWCKPFGVFVGNAELK